jgi:hypothetical protein
MINAEDCTVKTPIDSDIPENPSRTLFAPPAPDERPSLYTAGKVKHYLAQQIHKLMSSGAFRPGFSDYGAIQSTHAEVLHFLSSLPPAMRLEKPDTSWDFQWPDMIKHRLQISIIANAFLLALHKNHAAQHPHSLDLAVSAAVQVLDASQLLFEKTEPHQYKIYTLVFYTIDAGLVLSAMLAKYSARVEQARGHAITSLRQAIVRLSVLKGSVSAAVAGEKALSQCLEKLGCSNEHMYVDQRDSERPATKHGKAGAQQIQPSPQAIPEDAGHAPIHGNSIVTPTSNFLQPEPSFALDQWGSDGADLFTQIMDDDAWTASWLEQMNRIQSMNFDFEEDGFV